MLSSVSGDLVSFFSLHRLRQGILLCALLCVSIALFGCSPGQPTTETTAEATAETTPMDGGTTEETLPKDGGTGHVHPKDGGSDHESTPEPEPVQIRASGPDKEIDPGQSGPYAVGVTTLRLTDPNRKDDKTGQPRSMVMEVWYPATDKARDMPKDAYDISKDAPDAVKQKLKSFNITLPLMKQNAYRDAEPLRREGPYPLILFSHGSGGIRFQSIFQMVHLASHGYVVVSVDHAGNTLYDLFLDSNAQDPKNLFQAAVYRPIDVKFMLEEMKKRNQDEKDRFYKLVNLEAVGATGHSFGGMTSVLVTRDIKEVSVIIPQAPHTSLVNALGVEPHHVRNVVVMVMGAKDDRTLSYEKEEKAFYDKAITKPYHGADRYLVTLERGGHFSYSNICDLDLKQYAKRLGFGNVDSILSDGCAAHNTPIQEAHRIINYYSTALFNVLLRKSKLSEKYLKPMEGNKEITFEYTPAP